MRRAVWLGEVPTHCQMSGTPIRNVFVDGRIPGSSTWAIMSLGYFRKNGGHIGIGRGQVYTKQEDGTWVKTDG